jgi:hypothetical protein
MPAPVAEPPPVARKSLLLDRHGEPGDQPRDFIQVLGIMRFNGLREPKQAFVVTHGGNVAWDDRRNRAYQVGCNGWHRISSHETRRDRAFWAIESNWRPDRSHLCMTQLRLSGSGHHLPEGRRRRQIVVPHGLSGPASSQRAACELVLCKPERLCYTLPAREPLFRLFLGSSAVEHSTVNRMVAGSNPARGAKSDQALSSKLPLLELVRIFGLHTPCTL